MFFKNFFSNILPNYCLICGRILREKSICSYCHNHLEQIYVGKRCKSCFKPILNNYDDYCLNCQSEDLPFRYIRYIWEYKELESLFIKKMKYHNSYKLLKLASYYLIENYKKFFNGELHDVIIPAYSSQKSVAKRGFLHTYFLAKNIYHYIKKQNKKVILATYSSFPTDYDKKATSSLKSRFHYSKIGLKLNYDCILNKKILFIDDMITTGSTALNLLHYLNTDKYESFDVFTLGVASDFYENLEKSIKIFKELHL